MRRGEENWKRGEKEKREREEAIGWYFCSFVP
jgi:hypothetical protein